jgi:UDP-galactopyranose mutase
VISGATFVYLSACDWDAPWHGPQEIARRLGSAGNRVLYVETLGWRKPRGFDIPRILGRMSKATGLSGDQLPPGVSRISPLLLPGATSRPARAVNGALLRGAIRRRLDGAGAPLVAWVYTPYRLALDVLDGLDADLVVYHCTQAHRFRPGAPPDTGQVEDALLERADVVIVDGAELERELAARHGELHRVPSGVDPVPYGDARPPGWMRSLPHPVVGYLGSVDHRIDVDLLAGIAEARPGWTIAVVGPVTDAKIDELRARRNVLLHGHVPPEDVPATLAGFDVGLLPYAPLEMTAYTYPAKLHQYFAAGLPVVSVPLPDLEEFADFVNLATDVSGFVDAVERALAEPEGGADARRAIAARNSWQQRIDDLSRIVERALGARAPSGERDSKRPELVCQERERRERRDGQRLGGDLTDPDGDEAAEHEEVSSQAPQTDE